MMSVNRRYFIIIKEVGMIMRKTAWKGLSGVRKRVAAGALILSLTAGLAGYPVLAGGEPGGIPAERPGKGAYKARHFQLDMDAEVWTPLIEQHAPEYADAWQEAIQRREEIFDQLKSQWPTHPELTDEQKAEMEARRAEMKEKTPPANRPELTEEQKAEMEARRAEMKEKVPPADLPELTEEQKAEMEAKRAEMEAERVFYTQFQETIDASDWDAFRALVPELLERFNGQTDEMAGVIP
jgi:flagellar biosynthesis GTPase FlhF